MYFYGLNIKFVVKNNGKTEDPRRLKTEKISDYVIIRFVK